MLGTVFKSSIKTLCKPFGLGSKPEALVRKMCTSSQKHSANGVMQPQSSLYTPQRKEMSPQDLDLDFSKLKINSLPIIEKSPLDCLLGEESLIPNSETLECATMIKIRRQKMNKHKLRKRRKSLRRKDKGVRVPDSKVVKKLIAQEALNKGLVAL